MANLLRDILSIDEDDAILGRMEMIDLLVLTELLAGRPGLPKRFSKEIVGQVDGWFEQADAKSQVFLEWIRGQEGFSKADEVLGSLGMAPAGNGKSGAEKCRQTGYLATLRAIVMWQRAHGIPVADVQRRWKVKDVAEVEESWRDDRLFMLAGMSRIFELRCFYYHLKEECGADDERIHRVKRQLQRMASMARQLMALIGWCSPLGPLFLRLRRSAIVQQRIAGEATMQESLRTMECTCAAN
ncbi:MAG: hypothetical protein R3F19_12015 [Verrucomicrobiales bacterium]